MPETRQCGYRATVHCTPGYLSRIADYWHHWSDVAAGACIGNLAAYFAYRLRYPPPWVGDATPHAALLDAAAASKHLRGKLSPPSEV